uniref:BF1531-like N-terminal domain-containing protein n=1 Tax=uncultured marine microorganism HF4000_APKG8K5 TaxID=455555 RepID=B3TB43_9ZZZZ|nr:hypothetical protein ALOHA_HF4000APKG8K5ctg1g21 [uncultured marine microorganism HF4000_APKG8K5]
MPARARKSPPKEDVPPSFGGADLLSRPVEEITRLAKRLNKDKAALSEMGPAIRVTVLSSFLTDYLVEMLPLMFARRGLAATITKGQYGAIAPALLDKEGSLFAETPDFLILLPSHRDLAHLPAPGCDVGTAARAVEKEVALWTDLWAHLPCPAVQLSFDPPLLRPQGDQDGLAPGGVVRHVRRVNMELADKAPSLVTLVDCEHLAQRLGQDKWHDPRLYHMCKQPFSFEALPELADSLAAVVSARAGRGRKVLVLDLDNTLWGGVVGDVGLEGLELGPETPEGEAFTAFQEYVAALKQRGVVLAVCSKNTEKMAHLPFREHSGMVLGESDIACFIANFEDKASNLLAIARELNVGLDSLVLADDSPVERAWVREQLPEVLVVDLPEEPAGFPRTLDAAKAFPVGRLTQEDLERAASYQARAQTRAAMSRAGDLEAFLAGLEPQATIEPVGPGSVDRIVQLIAKTNQFKLNPKVFSADEISKRAEHVIALHLRDRLQDYGIVAVAVLEPGDEALAIENWVMSCRLFSRRLEHVMRHLISERARELGAQHLRLVYRESDRNGLLADLLPELGFAPSEESGQEDIWVATSQIPDGMPEHYMKIIRPQQAD